MFRVIGGAVVYGLALYGVVKLLDRRTKAVVIHSVTKPGHKMGSEPSAEATDSRDAGKSTDHAGEALSRASTPTDAVL